MFSKFPAAVKPFPQELINEVFAGVEREKKARPSGPWYAAFDADGTLWSFDVGETFFQYQLDHCDLKDLPADPWARYEDMKQNNPPWDCMWLAQINKGVPYSRLQAWAVDCFKRLPRFEYFQFQKDLIDGLRKRGVEVYVVTASVRWAMLPVVYDIFNIPEHRVLGIETHIRDGVITDEPVHPIVWGPGKADAILKATGGVKPLLSCGNSMLDLGLLECASQVRVTINSHPPGTDGYLTESRLAEQARNRGWLPHQTY